MLVQLVSQLQYARFLAAHFKRGYISRLLHPVCFLLQRYKKCTKVAPKTDKKCSTLVHFSS
jgi:hypothetical protein